MSLEQKIEQLTAALVVLTEKTDALISIRTDAVETIKTAAAPAGKKAEAKKADALKTEESAPTKAEEPAAPAAADESVYQEAKDLVKQFTTGSTRPEEVQARKAKVRELLRHKVLCKPELLENTETFSVTDVMEAKIPQLIKNLQVAIERGDITQPAAAADAGDDLL